MNLYSMPTMIVVVLYRISQRNWSHMLVKGLARYWITPPRVVCFAELSKVKPITVIWFVNQITVIGFTLHESFQLPMVI